MKLNQLFEMAAKRLCDKRGKSMAAEQRTEEYGLNINELLGYVVY